MASYAAWKAGSITVPGSTGSVSYTPTGWEGRTPVALIFYGTNWLTEDAADTSSGLGLFRGMAAPKWDDLGTINQQAACVITTPRGNAHSTQNNAIRQLNTGGGATALYVANVTSFDAGGFTLNWTTAASGGYKVVYVAMFDVDNIGSRLGAFDGTTCDPGWKAGSSLLHGAWGGPIDGTDRTQEFYGGAGYPSGNHLNWAGAGATIFCFPTSPGQQSMTELWNSNPSTIIASGGHFLGPNLIPSNIVAYPTGSPSAGSNFYIGGDSFDGGMTVWWDDEDSRCFFQSPSQSTGATSTKTGLPFEPGLLLGYTISNEPQGMDVLRGAIGFSVVTADFQWCATVDGVSSQGAFQSFQRGIADCVNGTNVHAATIELTSDGFVMTTEEDDATADTALWHAFGHPWIPEGIWRPQIYRLVMFRGGRSSTSTLNVGAGGNAILQESGFTILLEDDDGHLIQEE